MKREYSSGAFIYRKEGGKVLILFLKRDSDYDLPKGHIEKGENAEEAAKREIMEESGLEGQFIPYFSAQTTYVFRQANDKIFKTVKFFLERSETEKVRISHEHVGYEWMSYEDIMSRIRYKDIKSIIPRVFDYIDRHERMALLNAEYARLPETVKDWDLSGRLVRGEGPLDAGTMLLGEAPGAVEDEMGRPFVGRSGRMLDRILRKARLRRESFYITSVVQFRPPENRLPKSSEIEACKQFLEKQIAIVNPKNIILLGRTASKLMLDVDSIGDNHSSSVERGGIRYFVTYHPAAALRSTTNTNRMIEDFRKIKTIIKEA